MNQVLNIRSALVADYEGVSLLWKDVEHLHYQTLPHLFRKPDEDWPTRAGIESLIVDPDSTILVAEENSAITGFVALKIYRVEQTARMRGRRFVMIENMAVHPRHRRLGIGRALLKAAQEWADQRGVADLQLYVWAFNETAARFYESEGFVTTHRGMARRLKNTNGGA